MGFRNPGSIIGSTMRQEHAGDIMWKNPPKPAMDNLDELLRVGGTFIYKGARCVIVGRDVAIGQDDFHATYWLRPVVFQQGEEPCQDQTR